MRKSYFFYEFSDGFSKYMSEEEADKYEKENLCSRVRDDCQRNRESFVRMTKDGFSIGYNPALGMHIRGRKHYNQVLKERNLIEMGKERKPQTSPGPLKVFDDNLLKAAVDSGAEISGCEAEALKDGTFDQVNLPDDINIKGAGGFSG